MRPQSDRRIPGQPWHAVKVGVVAGQFGQAVGLHDGHDQGVVRQQSVLLAKDHCGTQQGRWDRQDLERRLEDRFHRPAELRQGLEDARLLLESPLDFSQSPAGQLRDLGDHHLVGDFAQDMRGREALEFLVLDPLD